MGWRTEGCGCTSGAGCSHRRPSPLCVIPGEELSVAVPTDQPAGSGPVRGQVRTTPNGGRLLLDLLPYLTADPADPNLINLDLPPAATQPLTTSGYWDIWVGGERAGHGPFIVGRSISSGPGKILTSAPWRPALTVGEPFHRDIGTDGLLPAGETLGGGPVSLTITAADGQALAWTAPPAIAADPATGTILLRLPADALHGAPAGDGTYLLAATTSSGSTRMILAGTLTIAEGTPL